MANRQRMLLKQNFGLRATFTGEFASYGSKTKKRKFLTTICLRNVRDANGVIVTDHLWFNRTAGFDQFGVLNKRDVLKFDARITSYRRSNNGLDYRLSHPTKISLKPSYA